MPLDLSSAVDDDQEGRVRLFAEVYFDRGWSGVLPPAAVTVLTPLTMLGPLTEADLHEQVISSGSAEQGLASAVWAPLHPWTDEELQALRDEQCPDNPVLVAEEPVRSAVDVRAQETQERARHVAELERHRAAVGAAPVHTIADLVSFMTVCGVLAVDEVGRYRISRAAPLPEEVLPVKGSNPDDDHADGTDMV